jgi:hypothetical protein
MWDASRPGEVALEVFEERFPVSLRDDPPDQFVKCVACTVGKRPRCIEPPSSVKMKHAASGLGESGKRRLVDTHC